MGALMARQPRPNPALWAALAAGDWPTAPAPEPEPEPLEPEPEPEPELAEVVQLRPPGLPGRRTTRDSRRAPEAQRDHPEDWAPAPEALLRHPGLAGVKGAGPCKLFLELSLQVWQTRNDAQRATACMVLDLPQAAANLGVPYSTALSWLHHLEAMQLVRLIPPEKPHSAPHVRLWTANGLPL